MSSSFGLESQLDGRAETLDQRAAGGVAEVGSGEREPAQARETWRGREQRHAGLSDRIAIEHELLELARERRARQGVKAIGADLGVAQAELAETAERRRRRDRDGPGVSDGVVLDFDPL